MVPLFKSRCQLDDVMTHLYLNVHLFKLHNEDAYFLYFFLLYRY